MRGVRGAVVLIVFVACVPAGTGGRGGNAPGAGAVTLDARQLATAVVVQAPSVEWSRPLASLIGDAAARDTACKTRTTGAPIASFRLDAPIDDLLITVSPKAGYTEFVVVGPKRYWQQCNGNTMTQPPSEWTPGTYEIYPTTGEAPFVVTFSSEKAVAAARASGGASSETAIVIAEPLAKPRLVTIKGKAKRAFLPDSVSGKNCEQFAMPSSPDFTVKVETAQTVVVRVLPTKADAILGVGEGPKRYCKDKKEQPDRYELTAERGVMAFSLGSQKAEAMPELTLLITDATTVADPFMQHSYGDADPPLADRDLHLHFPQLGTSNDRTTNWARQEQVGQLFVTAPRKIWVYATMDQTSNSSTIRKGEPLLLWELDNNIAEVLTLDGVPVRIRSAGLTTTAPASIGWPAEPHEVPTPGDSDLHRMLPPKDVPEAQKMYDAINRWDKCRDDAFAPFAAKLPPPPAADKEIVYKNDAYVRIENAGRAAQDRKCGAAATFEAKTLAPMRKKLLALIATARAKALGELVAKLQK